MIGDGGLIGDWGLEFGDLLNCEREDHGIN